MAALTAGDFIRPAKSLVSSSIPTMRMYETSGMTWKVGECIKNCSGKAAQATSGGINDDVIGVTVTTGKASSGTGTYVEFVPAVSWVVFEGTVYNATTASSIIARSDMFKKYALKRSSTLGIWYIDKADTSPAAITIIGFRDDTGTTNGRVYFIFNDAGRDPVWD